MNQNTPTGARILEYIDQLAEISESADNLTRVSFSAEHKRANALVAQWMTAAGMSTRTDAIGNIIGRYEGEKEGPALMIGSHLDTVRNGGRFDGMLGVVAPIVCIEQLHKHNRRLPFAVEVIGFCDEEGVRFPSTLLGSRAIAGSLDQAVLQECDAANISIAEAIRQFGCDPQAIDTVKRRPQDLIGFIEIHIEQGPILEREGLPVGLVTAISGASRYRIAVSGKAGHAGTVPMGMRKDALAAAAESILEIERICTTLPDIVGTVGMINALPGAGNVIPGDVEFSLDLRSGKDNNRKDAQAQIFESLAAIAKRREVNIQPQLTYEATSTDCDERLSRQLAVAIENSGYRLHTLPSGAGHDAMAMADITPVAMLFVRCKDGISHHPDESITGEDANAAATVLLNLLTEPDINA